MSSASKKKPKSTTEAVPEPLVRARLISKTGPSAGLSFALTSERPMIVGRSRSAGILLPDQLVSREHARIGFENGHFLLEHLSSSNSTRLNGEETRREILQHLDVIGFGPESEFIFLLDRTVAAAPSSRTLRRLTLVPSGAAGEPVSMEPGTATIGRAAGNDLVLEHKAVSSQHARIQIGADKAEIEDLGSANGTTVNERRVDSKVPLADGDVVVFGKVVGFVVKLEWEAEPKQGPAGGWRLAAEEDALILPIPSEAGHYVIGREVGCDLVVENKKSVSRRHAEVIVDEAGRLSVRDQASGNGTFVNGLKIRESELRLGDRVQFGLVVFRVEGKG